MYCGTDASEDSWADSTVDVIIDSTERVIFSLATDSIGRVVSDILSAASVSASDKITVSVISVLVSTVVSTTILVVVSVMSSAMISCCCDV